jgi:hypothetical protein
VQESLGPAGNLLTDLARAFDKPGESGSSLDLSKMFKFLKGPKK